MLAQRHLMHCQNVLVSAQVTQVRVKFLDDQNRLIMRNVKGPVREGEHPPQSRCSHLFMRYRGGCRGACVVTIERTESRCADPCV